MENSFNKSKITILSKIQSKQADTDNNSPLKTQNDLDNLLESIKDNNRSELNTQYVQEKLQKINEKFSKRNDKGQEYFYLESQENYEEYFKFINSKNRIAIMRAIREKNIELLVEENKKFLKKREKIKNNFFTHDDNYRNNHYNNKDDYKIRSGPFNYGNNKSDYQNDKNHYNNCKKIDFKNNTKESFDVKDKNYVEEDKCLKTYFKAIAIIANNVKQEELNKKEKSCIPNEIENKNLKTCSNNNSYLKNNFTKFENWNVNNSNKKETLFNKNNNEKFNSDQNRGVYKQSRNISTAQDKSRIKNFKEIKEDQFSSTHTKTDKKTFYQTLNNYMNYSGNNNLIKQIAGKFDLEEANQDMIESNPLVYNLNFNPLKKEVLQINQNIGCETDKLNKLEYLKKIAFVDKNDTKLHKRINRIGTRASNSESDFLNFDDDNVIIKQLNEGNFKTCDPEENNLNKHNKKNHKNLYKNLLFDKINDIDNNNNRNIMDNFEEKITMENNFSKQHIDVIARKLLKTCNFTHDKNKNNDRRLLSGNGKSMINSGISVKDFRQKFHI